MEFRAPRKRSGFPEISCEWRAVKADRLARQVAPPNGRESAPRIRDRMRKVRARDAIARASQTAPRVPGPGPRVDRRCLAGGRVLRLEPLRLSTSCFRGSWA